MRWKPVVLVALFCLMAAFGRPGLPVSESLQAASVNSIASPDTLGDVGYWSSLDLDANGHPVVSYYDGTNGHLKVLHCGNATCTSANAIVSPDTAGSVGLRSSLELDGSGNPVVAYVDSTAGEFAGHLKLLHCGNPTCTLGNVMLTVDSGSNVGWMQSLAIDANGNPVVGYPDSGNGSLKVLHCGNSTCTSGNAMVSPDTGNVGWMPSLALDSVGNPVVGYLEITSSPYPVGHLKVLHCGNPTCTSGNSIVSPDQGEEAWGLSLTLDSIDRPVIAYRGGGFMKILHCGDPTCASGNSIVSPDSASRNSGDYSIALDASGAPTVSYVGDDGLALLHCGDPNCASGNSIAVVDNPRTLGGMTSLALDTSGKPVVSYEDGLNLDLKVLHCSDPNCSGNFSADALDGTWRWLDTTSGGAQFTGIATVYAFGAFGVPQPFGWGWVDQNGAGWSSGPPAVMPTLVGDQVTLPAMTNDRSLSATWTGTIAANGQAISGTWTQSDGQHGTFIATKVTDALQLLSDGSWKFSRTNPANWQQPGFNDSGWGATVGNSSGLCGTHSGAMWAPNPIEHETIFVRKTFTLASTPENAILTVEFDDDGFVYVNGTLVHANNDGYASGFRSVRIASLLHPGSNVIAIQATDTAGGCQSIGLSASIIVTAPPPPTPDPSRHRFVIFVGGIDSSFNCDSPDHSSDQWNSLMNSLGLIGSDVFVFSYKYGYGLLQDDCRGSEPHPFSRAQYSATDTCGSIDADGSDHGYAVAFDQWFRKLQQLYPRSTFSIVAHSMGGVVVTYWAAHVASYRDELRPAVRSIITLDSPLQGILGAPANIFSHCFLAGDALQDLQPNSAVVIQINQQHDPGNCAPLPLIVRFGRVRRIRGNGGEPTELANRMVVRTVSNEGDGIVPMQVSCLWGASDFPVSDRCNILAILSHNCVFYNSEVQAQLVRWLR
jgi:hypothetical protein